MIDPKRRSLLGTLCFLNKKKKNTLDPPVRPHVLRVVEIRKSGVAVLQGSDATTIRHQVSKLGHCSVPVTDTNLYPATFVRTDKVHCQRCGNRKPYATMLLCDVCNEGWHITCLDVQLDRVPLNGWVCEKHKVKLLPQKFRRSIMLSFIIVCGRPSLELTNYNADPTGPNA